MWKQLKNFSFGEFSNSAQNKIGGVCEHLTRLWGMMKYIKPLMKTACKTIQILQCWLSMVPFLSTQGAPCSGDWPLLKSIGNRGKMPRNSFWPQHCPATYCLLYPEILQESKLRVAWKPEHSASLLCVLQSEQLCYISVVGGGYAVNWYKCLLQWNLPHHEYGFQQHFHSLNYFADGLITWG